MSNIKVLGEYKPVSYISIEEIVERLKRISPHKDKISFWENNATFEYNIETDEIQYVANINYAMPAQPIHSREEYYDPIYTTMTAMKKYDDFDYDLECGRYKDHMNKWVEMIRTNNNAEETELVGVIKIYIDVYYKFE